MAKQFIQVTIKGRQQLLNLSAIYNFAENENSGCKITTENGHVLYCEETFDQICEALDEILC